MSLLGWDRAQLLADLRTATPSQLEPRWSAWLARRAQREPTAYIVGMREFWGRAFAVSPAVLIPRPESELIVEEVLALAGTAPVQIADVGTGSGCLAISIAAGAPQVSVTATDISDDALAVARENARRHNVQERVTFVHTSFLNGVDGPFDIIAANPPYVKSTDKPALSRQVVGYEPHVALFGGTDGLDALRATLTAARDTLVPGGHLVMEFGFGQDDQVEALIAAHAELRLERMRQDLQGISRTVVVRRAGGA